MAIAGAGRGGSADRRKFEARPCAGRLVAALEQWPESGVPDNPGAWLMAVARRRGIDAIRRAVTLQRKVELLGRELSDHEIPMDETDFDPRVEDDVLRLMFTACHPVLSVEARVALTLKIVAGLSTEEIARAFLVQTATMAARITRARGRSPQRTCPLSFRSARRSPTG